jgi:Fic/DOC family
MLIALQKEIVDSRFALDDYRTFQNYVGEEPLPGELLVYYISPRPDDLPGLMAGLLECGGQMSQSQLHPVLVAAVVAFGFVFLHPFWDGNGRIHRLLIHYVLGRMGFSPEEIVFPISSVMVRDRAGYDAILERVSRPLSRLITNYSVDEAGEMKVKQPTADYYRYLDFTAIAEYLFDCVKRTIEFDFRHELDFLVQYDAIKEGVRSIIELPERQLDLLINCLRQNHGKLSARKRQRYFSMLTDEEVAQLEKLFLDDGTL